MSGLPKISIVTPNYNNDLYLEETIDSVLSQNYGNLEYIIIDGGSTDKSIDIIKKYEKHLKIWVSEKDNGLYHALNKGFKLSSGEIMGWINSDDLLHRKSLFTLAEIFSSFPNVKWVQGYNSFFDAQGRIVNAGLNQKNKYFFYLKEYLNNKSGNPYIQQESTYWRRDLWEKAGAYISTDYKLAGDFELWMRFFQYEKLYSISGLIGGFRWGLNNMNLRKDTGLTYSEEANLIIEKLNLSVSDLKDLETIRLYRKWMKLPLGKRLFYTRYWKQFVKPDHIFFNYSDQKFKI